MTRQEKDSKVIKKTLENKAKQLKNDIAFKRDFIEYHKHWLAGATAEQTDMLMKNLVQDQIELRILEATLKAVEDMQKEA